MHNCCMLCGKVSSGGLKVMGAGICSRCEGRLKAMDSRSRVYGAYVARVKMLLRTVGV